MPRKPDVDPADVIFRLKGKFLDENLRAQGYFSQHFVITRDRLYIGDRGWVPLEKAMRCDVVGNKLAFAISRPGRDDAHGFQVTEWSAAAKAEDFKRKLDQARSVRVLQIKRKKLARLGREDELKVELCPCCRTPVDMTRFGDYSQLYCPFCGRISTLGDERANAVERDYTFCDSCGYFGRIREYSTIKLGLFFFFLYYVWWNVLREKLCPTCARRNARNRALYCLALSMVLAPLTVGHNLVAYFRALFAERGSAGEMFGELARANRLAIKGRSDEALALYAEIAKGTRHAGVLTNMGSVLVQEGDLEMAVRAFEGSIGLCPNYLPNHELLTGVLAELGRDEESGEVARRARYLREVDGTAGSGAQKVEKADPDG